MVKVQFIHNVSEAAGRIADADSPERFSTEVRQLLCLLADECHEASGTVTTAWQEEAPGEPWSRMAQLFSQLDDILSREIG